MPSAVNVYAVCALSPSTAIWPLPSGDSVKSGVVTVSSAAVATTCALVAPGMAKLTITDKTLLGFCVTLMSGAAAGGLQAPSASAAHTIHRESILGCTGFPLLG